MLGENSLFSPSSHSFSHPLSTLCVAVCQCSIVLPVLLFPVCLSTLLKWKSCFCLSCSNIYQASASNKLIAIWSHKVTWSSVNLFPQTTRPSVTCLHGDLSDQKEGLNRHPGLHRAAPVEVVNAVVDKQSAVFPVDVTQPSTSQIMVSQYIYRDQH